MNYDEILDYEWPSLSGNRIDISFYGGPSFSGIRSGAPTALCGAYMLNRNSHMSCER